jgi:hypothetical protein
MRLVASAVLIGLLNLLVAPPVLGDPVTWTRVGTGMQQGVSGLAPAPDGGWVMVRDNKLSGQNRVALLSAAGVVTQLTWPGSAPVDLEAIDAVPGRPGQYAVVTSAGAGRIISVTGTTLTVVRSFQLPAGLNQNEGFALTRRDATLIAVWGNRGSVTAPGRLFAATFDPDAGVFGAFVSGAVRVPYPQTSVRHISDTTVLDDGRIMVSSTSDPGTSGPFASAVYDVGSVSLVAGRARLSLVTPSSRGTFEGHKVEAIACAGTSGLLGADDEKLGGWVAAIDVCG